MLKLKRIIAAAVIAVAAIIPQSGQCMAAVNPDDYVCLPIIMYHSVRPHNSDKDSITPQEFERDLKFFQDNNYTAVTMNEIFAFVEGRGELPEKPVVLAFDDGFYNNYKYVYPLLQKYDTRIVMSIIAGATDRFTRKPSKSEDYAHLTWGQLNEMITSGHVEVQNHTYDMHTAKGRVGVKQKDGESLDAYRNAISDDLIEAQAMIYIMTGHMPTVFTYPYGKYNNNTIIILKELGFKAAFSCQFGINLIDRETHEVDFFNMMRICRAHGQSAEKVISDAMETLKFRQL